MIVVKVVDATRDEYVSRVFEQSKQVVFEATADFGKALRFNNLEDAKACVATLNQSWEFHPIEVTE